jgi:putative addiction module killer protein
MHELRQTEVFRDWLTNLGDLRAKARIQARIDRLALGDPGDTKLIGDGIRELRIDCGPGYRVYYVRRGRVLVILLCGGDKSSQGKDIKRARLLAARLEE